jgi:hypothetical protein
MNENERWQMYGLQSIERVNAKRMIWSELAEPTRILKLAVDRDVLEHLQQLEKDPQSCAKMFWKTFFPSFPVFFPLPPLAMLIILTALPCATQK